MRKDKDSFSLSFMWALGVGFSCLTQAVIMSQLTEEGEGWRMSIPDYQSIMLPLLEFAGDGREHTVREAIESLAARFGLTDQERKMLLPSGQYVSIIAAIV